MFVGSTISFWVKIRSTKGKIERIVTPLNKAATREQRKAMQNNKIFGLKNLNNLRYSLIGIDFITPIDFPQAI